jgi:radical SAM protein with 4Fe4S-binding SPASM domain
LPLQNLLEVEDFFCTQASQILHFDADVRFGTVRHTDGKYLESLAPADRRLPGQATLYKRFLANVASGLINRDPFDHKWTFQRLFFEKPFQTFLNREIASPERPCLDGRSRLYTMCIPGKTGCFVSVDGNYYTCERAPNCETFRIGDVWHGIDTARSYKLWSGFVKMCDDECRRCWCVNLCRIGCCAFVREGDECSPKAKREACDRYRASMHRMLTDLFTVLESNPHAFDYLKNADRRNAGAAGPEEK